MIQASMSADIRIGSTPSHLMYLNFWPLVLTTMKCIGLRHFGQVGDGGFLAWVLSTWRKQKYIHLAIGSLSQNTAAWAWHS